MCQELSYQAVLQECRGESVLPEGFGEGSVCVCGETRLQDFQATCSNCILSKESLGFEEDYRPEAKTGTQEEPETTTEQCMYTQDQKNQAEALAQELYQNQKYALQDIEPLLKHTSPTCSLVGCEAWCPRNRRATTYSACMHMAACME